MPFAIKFKKPALGARARTLLVLGIALLLGLLAAFGARSYFARRMADIEARARGQTIGVVVAKEDLTRGARLTPATVAVRQVPVAYAHSQALLPQHFSRVADQPLAYGVKSGEMILWSLLADKRAPTFSSRVETGRRAVTVPVDEISSISGLLEPGDVIDLVLTLNHKSRKLTFPLLQSVQVMATGQRVVDEAKGGERRSYSTVTLDTSPEQAQFVIVGREAGRITALLRNPGDKQPLPNARGDVAELLGLKDGAVVARADADLQVPVLYGGRGGGLPAEGMQLGQYVRPDSAPRSGGDPQLNRIGESAARAASATTASARAQQP